MQEIAPGIFLIEPPEKAVFPYSNSLYIDGSVKALIDAGSGRTAYAGIMANKLDLLLLSHYHFDHTNGSEFFPDARIMCGREELWAYNDEQRYVESSGYSQWDQLMDVERSGIFARTFDQPDDIPTVPGFRPIEISGIFKDGDVFDFGNTSMQAIHTPGHTPGHYAFFFPDEKLLFSCDSDLSSWGPWYGAMVSDFGAIVNSIEKLIELHPRIIVTSHRRQIFTDNLEQRLHAFLDIPLKKEEQILDFLKQAHTLKEILRQDFVHLYPPRSSYQTFWNRLMVKKHLDRMVDNGSIRLDQSGFYRA